MDKERNLKEIEENQLSILPDAKNYRVIRYQYDGNFEPQEASLVLTLQNQNTKEIVRLNFKNVHSNEEMFSTLRDSTGIYLIDTSYLGYSPKQRIEVGDWDGDPPIFWAEKVEKQK